MTASSSLDFTTTEFDYVETYTYEKYIKNEKNLRIFTRTFITLFAVGIIASLAIFIASTFLSLKYIKTSKVIKSTILLKILSILASTIPFSITSSGIFITSFISIRNKKRNEERYKTREVQISLGNGNNFLSNAQIENEIKKLNSLIEENLPYDETKSQSSEKKISEENTKLTSLCKLYYNIRYDVAKQPAECNSLIIYVQETTLNAESLSKFIQDFGIDKLIISSNNFEEEKIDYANFPGFYLRTFPAISIEEALNDKIPCGTYAKPIGSKIYIVKPNT